MTLEPHIYMYTSNSKDSVYSLWRVIFDAFPLGNNFGWREPFYTGWKFQWYGGSEPWMLPAFPYSLKRGGGKLQRSHYQWQRLHNIVQVVRELLTKTIAIIVRNSGCTLFLGKVRKQHSHWTEVSKTKPFMNLSVAPMCCKMSNPQVLRV